MLNHTRRTPRAKNSLREKFEAKFGCQRRVYDAAVVVGAYALRRGSIWIRVYRDLSCSWERLYVVSVLRKKFGLSANKYADWAMLSKPSFFNKNPSRLGIILVFVL